ncbi:ATP-binding protein [Hydrogenophaga sp. PAMC20947]|uniref:ATP-binding protein n=1 Tax=Hydrogenophaga sp. PAMC20947 TaxID=2565558 RepID=UPI00109DDFEA|nr:ATP-binding protein [Hydrogenophaga sp. PAMC20947]QCB46174.1 HAMP domain-containing protein [Hydrogenophaga sp. PAMC20947]
MPSFRVRIFMVTALIVALVLTSVALFSWSSVLAFEGQRLDERLCDEVRRLAGPAPVNDVERLSTDMLAKLRLKSPEQLLLAVDTPSGADRLRSAHWPDTLDIDQLAWSREAVAADTQSPTNTPARSACALSRFDLAGGEWRAALVGSASERGFVAADQAAIRADLLGVWRQVAAIALPLALVLTALGAWLLSGLALRPVVRLRDAMKAVDEKALDQRLSVAHEDREFQDLITSYNKMLGRLETSFHQASRFSADAAHELKTPLTILQGQLERAVQRTDGQALQLTLIDMLDEVGRLSSISRKLLLLSQADAGRLALQRQPVNLSETLNERIAEAQTFGLDVTLSAEVADGLTVQADPQLLDQLLNNLTSNALKYTPAGGWIRWRVRSTPSGIELEMANFAPGLTSEDRSRLFERFFRGDAARNRQLGGHGLGLSLSRVIARAHGGDLTVVPGVDDALVLRLLLPAGT